jgi:hypothetical protein
MIPVVIIHEEYQQYLEINIQITGRNNKIFLIGNKSVKSLEKYPNVTYVDIQKYLNRDKYKDYDSSFVNYGNYERHFSWFTFIRTIIINDFMEDYSFDQVFSCDSDNILLQDINNYNYTKKNALCIPTEWEPFYYATSVHAALLSKSFCHEYEKMFQDIFVNKTRLEIAQPKIDYHKDHPGSISDMAFYHYLNKLGICEMDNLLEPKEVNGNEFVFIQNFANGEGPHSKNQYKVNRHGLKIKKNNYLQTNTIFDMDSKKSLNLYNIHFQGKKKRYLNKKLLTKLNF